MLNDIIFSVIITAILTFFIEKFVFPILPISIRNFTTYHKKKFLKILQHQEINIEMIVKTKNYAGDITIDEITKSLKETINKQFPVSFTNTSLIIKVPIGQETVEIHIIPMHYLDEGSMKFESLECRFISKCRFSKLRASILNFREAQNKIRNILEDISIPRFNPKIALTCKLKSLHEITTILENTHFESMNAELNTGQKFEIGKDQITIYDDEISDDTITLAKKMIILYD